VSASGWIDLRPPPEPPAIVFPCNGCDTMIGTHQAPANWTDPTTFFCVECLRAGVLLGVRRDPASLRPIEDAWDEEVVLGEAPVEAVEGGDEAADEAGASPSTDDDLEPKLGWDRMRARAEVLAGTYDPATAPFPDGF
jgi:hypothetical protein